MRPGDLYKSSTKEEPHRSFVGFKKTKSSEEQPKRLKQKKKAGAGGKKNNGGTARCQGIYERSTPKTKHRKRSIVRSSLPLFPLVLSLIGPGFGFILFLVSPSLLRITVHALHSLQPSSLLHPKPTKRPSWPTTRFQNKITKNKQKNKTYLRVTRLGPKEKNKGRGGEQGSPYQLRPSMRTPLTKHHGRTWQGKPTNYFWVWIPSRPQSDWRGPVSRSRQSVFILTVVIQQAHLTNIKANHGNSARSRSSHKTWTAVIG